MSRCFPFPPPGYVKTPRPEEDLSKEEKLREKKHKKEKKSKRKREGDDKEDKHKDRDKRKEKKEKRDKHRDKKDKEKIKNSISDDSTAAAQPGTSDRDNAHTREECSNYKSRGFSENKFASSFRGENGWSLTDNKLVRENDESKFVQELGRRIKDEGKAIGSRTIEKSSSADRRGYQEIHRSAVTGLLPSSANNMEFEIDQGIYPKIEEGKGPKKVEGKALKDGLLFNGNNKVQNLTGSIDRKVEMPPEPVHRVIERTVQIKEKCKEKSEDRRGEKRKDREKKEKKSHGKDKGRDKMKQNVKDEVKIREETEKQRTEYQKKDPDRSKELNGNEHPSSNKNINAYSSQVGNNIVSTEEKVEKRKAVETNGFAHENEIRSNKLLTHQLLNNGKILEASQSPGSLDNHRPLQDTSETKYHELNGTVVPQSSRIPRRKPPAAPSIRSDQIIEALEKPPFADKVVEAFNKLPQAPPVVVEVSSEVPVAGKVIETSRRALPASRVVESVRKHPRADRNSEPSRKPPHPDLKYLSEVLSVPKMEEWPEVDDQEWLFSNKNMPLEKEKLDIGVDSREQQVWSKALHIESADIYALPYVIPY